MFKYFYLAVVVGLIELLIVIGIGEIFGTSALYTTSIIGLMVYIGVLWWTLDKYEEYKEEFRIEKKEEIKEEIKEVEKPEVKIEIKEVEKPKKIEKLIPVTETTTTRIKNFNELKNYVRYNLYYGQKREDIEKKVLSVGWTKEEVARAFLEVGDIKPEGLLVLETKKIEKRPKKEIIKKVIVKEEKEEKPKKSYSHRYIASKDGGKYHLHSCHWGKSIDEKKERFFKTKSYAEKRGYKSCKQCIK